MRKLILLVLSLIFVASAEADSSLQCPSGRFITLGMTKAEAIIKCGTPKSQDRETYYTGDEENIQTTIIDEFVYEFQNYHAIVTFVNGRLQYVVSSPL